MEPGMSTLLWSRAKENPGPGLALASLNLVVALFLMGLSLLLGGTISLLAGLHAFVDREPRAGAACCQTAPLRMTQYMPSTSGRTAGERSWIAPKGLQRGSRAL
jgi:hypothetical protein